MTTTEREQIVRRHREAKALRIAERIWAAFDGHPDRPARLDDHMRDCPDDEWQGWQKVARMEKASEYVRDRVIVVLGNWEKSHRRWRAAADRVQYAGQDLRDRGE